MKKITLTFAALSALLLTFGCGQKDDSEEKLVSLSVSETSIAAGPSAGSHAISIAIRNGNGWRAEVNSEARAWCTLSAYEGSGSDVNDTIVIVVIVVSENVLLAERTATITLSSGTQSATVTLTQAAAAQVRGTFTITTAGTLPYSGNRQSVELEVVAQKILIDWGDGSTNNYDYSSSPDNTQKITHNYPDGSTEAYTISATVTTLRKLKCSSYNSSDNFTSVDVSGCSMLTYLSCYSSSLTNLNVSGCVALESLSSSGHNLTNFDISDCIALSNLEISGLDSLDVSNNIELSHLLVGIVGVSSGSHSKGLTVLDVSNNPKLIRLECFGNLLTNLDLSHNPELNLLNCSYNFLTNLNIGDGNTALGYVYIYDNQLSDEVLNALFTALPAVSAERAAQGSGRISIYDNPGANTCSKTIAMEKNWTFVTK